jgi:hypothetical protein
LRDRRALDHVDQRSEKSLDPVIVVSIVERDAVKLADLELQNFFRHDYPPFDSVFRRTISPPNASASPAAEPVRLTPTTAILPGKVWLKIRAVGSQVQAVVGRSVEWQEPTEQD